MAYIDMWKELKGCVSDLPVDYAKTLVNRAYADVGRQNLWSYQLFDSNWTSPNLITAGTATTVQGSTSVVADATAAAAINAQALGPPTPIIQRQFRVGISTIYNIWGWNPGSSILTLDRPYREVGSTNTYTIFQCYYPVPMLDFKTFISIRDIQNFLDLILTRTRAEVDASDPQRTWFYQPTTAVPYQPDLNPASPTYRYMMYELWGAPQYQLTYQLYGLRNGAPLVAPTDQLPPALGEDLVGALARKYAYEWAEAQKGATNGRNVGPDFRFLAGQAAADYARLFREYRRVDREVVNNFWSMQRHSPYGNCWGYYNTINGWASPSGWGG